MAHAQSILIASSDAASASELAESLLDMGIESSRARSGRELVVRLSKTPFDAVIVDVDLADGGIEAVLPVVASEYPDLPTIALVGPGDVDRAVHAVRAGAVDYLPKPVEAEELRYVVAKALHSGDLAQDALPHSALARPTTPMLGESAAMRELRGLLGRAARGDATVLVRGESGTGKELVARQLHELSSRRAAPFVKVHCAALPETLLESELFGYEKGAFTGAVARKPGRVELAEGGTLFLDEIGDISPATQVKLLRILQDRKYERLGGTNTLHADVRFVAATHRNLDVMVGEGAFRSDLFYRLNVVSRWVPPLRERPSDIDLLAMHFCRQFASRGQGRPASLDVGALEPFRRQAWPGNVRQLENFVERLVVLSDGPRITGADVERELARQAGTLGFAHTDRLGPKVNLKSSVLELAEAVRDAERRAIEKALQRASGNRNLAARLLGISRRTLYYKLQEHALG